MGLAFSECHRSFGARSAGQNAIPRWEWVPRDSARLASACCVEGCEAGISRCIRRVGRSSNGHRRLSAQLTSSGKTLVLSASPRPIEEAAASLAGYLKDNRWLGRNNRYVKETVQRLKEDLTGGGVLSPVRQKHLRELIAASAVTHCLDGWAMLGRAAGSTLLGDPHSARHLAYYAELRAACSLLARSGIAVLSGQHLVVDAHGTVMPIQGRRLYAVGVEPISPLGPFFRSGLRRRTPQIRRPPF